MMASSKLATSSGRSRNSDLSRRPSTKPKTATTTTPTTTPSSAVAAAAANPQIQIQNLNDDNSGFNYGYGTHTTSSSLQFGSMTLDGLMGDSNSASMTDATLLGAQITLLDNALAAAADINIPSGSPPPSRTVDEVWQDIVSGRTPKQTKQEAPEMTLEDFLARAGAVEEQDIKGFAPPPPPPHTTETERLSGEGLFSYDQISTLSPFGSIEKLEGSAFGNGGEVAASGGSGRGKRGRVVLEPLDKAAQQRQRRMIKNRESAARSRERKQAYQSELESLAVRLEEENEQLLKEQAERTEERRKQLMETVIPVVEKRRPSRALRRVRSLQW